MNVQVREKSISHITGVTDGEVGVWVFRTSDRNQGKGGTGVKIYGKVGVGGEVGVDGKPGPNRF